MIPWLLPTSPWRVGTVHAVGALVLGVVAGLTGLSIHGRLAWVLSGVAGDDAYAALPVHHAVGELLVLAALPILLGYLVLGTRGSQRPPAAWLGVAGVWLWILGGAFALAFSTAWSAPSGWAFDALAGDRPTTWPWLVPLTGLTLGSVHVGLMALRAGDRWRSPRCPTGWAVVMGALVGVALAALAATRLLRAATTADPVEQLLTSGALVFSGSSLWHWALALPTLVLAAPVLFGVAPAPVAHTDEGEPPRRALLPARLLAAGTVASLIIGLWAEVALGRETNAALHDTLIATIPAHAIGAGVVLAVLLGLTPRRPTRGSTIVATLAAASPAWVLTAHASLGSAGVPRRYLAIIDPAGWHDVAIVAAAIGVLSVAAYLGLCWRGHRGASDGHNTEDVARGRVG